LEEGVLKIVRQFFISELHRIFQMVDNLNNYSVSHAMSMGLEIRQIFNSFLTF
jgi:uncharacterized protein YfkK (UPF0435 family)